MIIIRKTQFSGEDKIALVVLISMIYILKELGQQLFALGNTSNNDVFGFDSKLLFLGAEIIAPILTKLYNASLTNNIVISDWKVSKVTPIFKGKGNKEEAGN